MELENFLISLLTNFHFYNFPDWQNVQGALFLVGAKVSSCLLAISKGQILKDLFYAKRLMLSIIVQILSKYVYYRN